MDLSAVLIVSRKKIFETFKYTIYVLLAINVIIFFQEEWQATEHTYAGGISLADIIEGFSATIDTAAWVILLLLFELETFVLPHEKITGSLEWTLHGIRAFCYIFIVYAFYGYLSKCLMLYDVGPVEIGDLCALADSATSYLVSLDEYVVINALNCATMPVTAEMYRLNNLDIVTDSYSLLATQRLAWTDVINAGDWILVVIVLEFDIWLQLKGHFKGVILTVSKGLKIILYGILFLAAVYWGVKGDFVDFWDAFLWLVAFVFIEMNVFEWQSETESHVY